MGRVKAWIMDQEDKFFAICDDTVSECETIQEFRSRVHQHFGLVSHMDEEEIEEGISYTWNEYWSEYNIGGK